MSLSRTENNSIPIVNAHAEEKDIVVSYDQETLDVSFSIANRPEIAFDPDDIVAQLNALDIGCQFSVSDLEEWTASATTVEEALDGVLNMVAMKVVARDGLAITYEDRAGTTRYDLTSKGVESAGGRRLPS